MVDPSSDLPGRIRALGLPDVVGRIAVDGGESVSPALWYRAKSVWPEVAEAAMGAVDEELVPLWACDTTHAFAGRGRYLLLAPEADEALSVFADFADLVRDLLTDLYEDEEDEAERERVAHLLLPAEEAEAALVPKER